MIAGVVASAAIFIVGIALILDGVKTELSPAVSELILLAATLAALTGMSTVVYRSVHGPLPALPASVAEEMGERRKVRRAALFCLLAWAISSAILFVSSRNAGAFFSVLTSLIGLPILSTFYMVARRRDRNVSSLLAQPWVCWEYDRETWRSFANGQTDRRLRQLGKQTPHLVAGPAGLLTGDKFLAWNEPGTYLTNAWRTRAAVVFRFRVNFGKGTMTLDMAAPIMSRAEEDLIRLQENLKSLKLRAEIQLV